MAVTRVGRTIAAPVERVFDVVSRIEAFREAVPDIVDVEFLTESRTGVGTRFRETRVMKGREASTVLEVTELVPNERIRLVSDAHGTVWDSVFSVRPAEAGCDLTLEMESRPHSLLARITTPMIAGMIRKALEADMDALKAYCETSPE